MAPPHPPAHGFGHAGRPALLRRGLLLAAATVAWSLVEGGVGLAAAWMAGSVALLGFGLDAVLEAGSSSVIVWRTTQERKAVDEAHLARIEVRASRAVAVGMAALAAYMAVQSVLDLLRRHKPDVSPLGIALAAVSVVVMFVLSRAKHRVGHALGSASMEADAFQSTACMALAAIVLVGTALNALFGWWWADPAAALVMVVPLTQEARKAWSGVHRH